MNRLEELENKAEKLFEQAYDLKAEIKKYKEENNFKNFNPYNNLPGFIWYGFEEKV